MREHYKEIGDAQGHKFGDNPPGTKAVDFNVQPKPGEKAGAASAGAPSAPKPTPKANPSDPASPTQ